MKKHIDWDAVEEQKIDSNEACECTRSKIQNIINQFKTLFLTPKKSSQCDSTSCCSKTDEINKD